MCSNTPNNPLSFLFTGIAFRHGVLPRSNQISPVPSSWQLSPTATRCPAHAPPTSHTGNTSRQQKYVPHYPEGNVAFTLLKRDTSALSTTRARLGGIKRTEQPTIHQICRQVWIPLATSRAPRNAFHAHQEMQPLPERGGAETVATVLADQSA